MTSFNHIHHNKTFRKILWRQLVQILIILVLVYLFAITVTNRKIHLLNQTFKFDAPELVSGGVVENTSKLTTKFLSISSDEKGHFDLMKSRKHPRK